MTDHKILDKLVEIANSLDSLPLKRSEPDPNQWINFWDMCEDIREHAKNNGRAVQIEDEPRQLKLGFICKNTHKKWLIRIVDFKKSLDSFEDQNKANFIRQSYQTVEGKENFAKSLNKKR